MDFGRVHVQYFSYSPRRHACFNWPCNTYMQFTLIDHDITVYCMHYLECIEKYLMKMKGKCQGEIIPVYPIYAWYRGINLTFNCM